MATITLVRGGYADTGGSLWHIWESQNHFMIYTSCQSELSIDNTQVRPLAEYNGGRRLSICSYCLKNLELHK